jgi:alkyldihydroxyacetonephosphate synthase
VRAFERDFAPAPDVVAYPTSEAEIVDLLDWVSGANVAAIPFGGGSSVVGGVEPAVGGGFAGTLTIDLRELGEVVEVDRASRAARIQAGAFGPALEKQLAPHGLTLRHFPQSFQYSTLGGWIATRSGGHFATLYTHIDDFVENLRVITPAGTVESRRLPGSGAGPSPDRLFIGSEGALGIITEAWMRLQDKPTFRASAPVHFTDFYAAAEAVRAISQAGLYPANCRLVDKDEAEISRAGDGSAHLLVLAFESADHPVDAWLARALECCADHGGSYDDPAAAKPDAHRGGAAGAWREAFIQAPYLREVLTSLGVMYDTFETAITWDRFPDFHAQIMTATKAIIREATGSEGHVTCRFTHAYPDGPAPYFSFHCRADKGRMIEQWRAIKQAASDKVIELGGTITHHHAVGRDHRPCYDRQRPDLFAEARGGAKARLDPAGIINPGILIGG